MQTKKSFWPYGIIAAFVIFIAGTVCLIALACSSPSDLVAKNYYEQEIRFQHRMESAARAARLSDASIIYNAAENRITVSIPPQNAASAVGTIHLYRPSASSLDQQLKLNTDAGGLQSIDTKKLTPGSWKVRVSWSVGEQEFYLERSVVVGS